MADVVAFIVMLVLYTAVMVYIGYRGYKATKNVQDWLVAGRRVGPLVVAMSYGATFISAVAIIGFGGQAQLFGLQLLWLSVLNIIVGILIAFIVFGNRTRIMSKTLQALTFTELLAKRFDSRFVQGFGGAVIAIFLIAYSAAVFKGTASLIQQTFGTSYTTAIVVFTVIVAVYVLLGGLFAVLWTDTVQGFIMLFGLAILLAIVWMQLGGPIAANEALAALGPAKMAPNGLTSVSPFGSTSFMLVSSLIFGVGIGVLAQPQLAVRFMAAKNTRAIRRGIPIGVIFIFLTTYVAFTVGALSNVVFKNYGVVPPTNPDLVIPTLINLAFPAWFVYLFLFALLAASMSTASSLFHVSGSAIGRDIYDKAIKKGLAGAASITVTKVATFVVIALTLLLSFVPARRSSISRYVFFRCFRRNIHCSLFSYALLETGDDARDNREHGRWSWRNTSVVRLCIPENCHGDITCQRSGPTWTARPAFYRDPGLLCIGYHRQLGDKATGRGAYRESVHRHLLKVSEAASTKFYSLESSHRLLNGWQTRSKRA